MYLKIASNRENNIFIFSKVPEKDLAYLQNKINEYVVKMATLVNKRAAAKLEPNLECIFLTGDQLQKIRMLINFKSFGVSNDSFQNSFVKDIIRKVQLINDENVKQKTYNHLVAVGQNLCLLVERLKEIENIIKNKRECASDFYDEIQHHLINSFAAINLALLRIEKDGLIKIDKKMILFTDQLDLFLKSKVTKIDYKERD